MENAKRLHCLLSEQKIYKVILKVIQRVRDLPATGMGSVWFYWRYFFSKDCSGCCSFWHDRNADESSGLDRVMATGNVAAFTAYI